MERPPRQPRRDQIPAAEQGAYDQIISRFRGGASGAGATEHVEVGAYFGALLNCPDMCALTSRLGLHFRGVGNTPGSYSHADREFVDQVLCAHWDTDVVQFQHIIDAARAGVRVDAIEALMARRDDLLNDDELLLATYIRQVVDGKVEQATYDRMQARLGTRGLVEYTGFIAFLGWTIRMMQALDTGAPTKEQIKADVKTAREVEAGLRKAGAPEG